MRKRKGWLLLPAALLAAGGATAAEWKHLGTSESGAEIYVDRSTLRKSGNAVSLWMMEDYKTTRTFSGKK